MRIAFYSPFKPLDHPRLSGDVAIAKGLWDFLAGRGHELALASGFTSEWAYWRPARWPALLAARRRLDRLMRDFSPQAFFCYHSYYRAPDLLGPAARKQGAAYFMFAGAFATKRRRRLRTWPGFHLNRRALLAADHHFANKIKDRQNLLRIAPWAKVTYLRPGIVTADYAFDPRAREFLRRAWEVGDEPVVLTAAVFRPGTKSQGLIWLIRSCGELIRQGLKLNLVLVGDGPERPRLMAEARRELGGRVRFAGLVEPREMARYYSAGDVFAFPGINEGLGMAYLEAQSCGLPAVAWDHDGAPEVIKDQVSGYITPSFALAPYAAAIGRLLADPGLRERMGRAAREYVRAEHEREANYLAMERVMLAKCGRGQS